MHRNRQAYIAALLAEYTVVSVNVQQISAMPLQEPDHRLAGDLLHTAISSTRRLPVCFAGLISTERHASAAS